MNGSFAHLILVKNPKHNISGDFYINNKSLLSYVQGTNKNTYSGIGIYHPDLFKDCQHGIYSVVPLLKQAMDQNKVTGQLYKGHLGCLKSKMNHHRLLMSLFQVVVNRYLQKQGVQ